jgi:putative CocE/NonD family hydrolase
MPDGVRIAVDLHLPTDLEADERLPALLLPNRYWRAMEMRWPIPEQPDERAEFFVRRGYAWVSFDVRGAGASFGVHRQPWSEKEIDDSMALVEWIVSQPWSNGRVGTEGSSYNGTAAELLLTRGHPAVRASAPRFSQFDAYTDIPFPGGVPQTWFLPVWAEANAALDAGSLPALAPWIGRLAVRGVRPASPDRSLLEAALAEHRDNRDPAAAMARGTFRDDREEGLSVDDISPKGHRQALEAGGAPLYGWSGWFDGANPRAAVERFLTLRIPGSRLILGPWSHGGGIGISPTSPGPSVFDPNAELLRFFDPLLADRPSGIEQTPPVAYYTMVEDRWKTSAVWPPPAEPLALYLAADGKLEPKPSANPGGADTYAVDPEAGTGRLTRWDALMGDLAVDLDRTKRDERLLTYTSAPLPNAIEVTGHPIVSLFVASSADDGVFIAYLEDVAPDGRVTLVTEGMLRALHRRLQPPSGPLAEIIPLRSFQRADAWPLVPGEVAELRFDLLPTSYRFRAGHAVRLALAGADRDHFARIPEHVAPTWQVQRNEGDPSRLLLPVPSATPAARSAP